MRKIGALLCAAGISLLPGCANKTVRSAAGATSSPIDNSYLDLQPGGRLRILVPILKSGGYQVTTDGAREVGNTIVLSAANLAGYEVSYYSVEGQRHGDVRLRFTSAEISKDGQTLAEKRARDLPFPLPSDAEHIRLVYLVRSSSQADHNMAIAASKKLNELNSFTDRLKGDPDVCKSDGAVFCTWVPKDIAVRPEE